jgi:hypothetical protein
MEELVQGHEAPKSSGSSIVLLVVLLIACLAGYALTQKATVPHLGTAPAAAITSGTSIYGPPTLTTAQINTILAAYHSPAAGTGQALYDLGKQYGIDPAFALAFFMHESTLGTQGEATVTLALGNERCINDRPCIDQDRGGYAQFQSWQDGYEHWYSLMTSDLYKGAGLTTVQRIIPRYAPTADHNDEQAYINSLLYSVNAWRSGKVVI